MADGQNNTSQQDSYFDPVKEARNGPLDVSSFDDKTLFSHLTDPTKFRAAIPKYAHLSDDEISNGMQKVALRRPDLSAPPENLGTPPSTPSELTSPLPGYFKRLGQSIGAPTSEDELKSALTPPSVKGVPIGAPGSGIGMIKNIGENVIESGKQFLRDPNLKTGISAAESVLNPIGWPLQKSFAEDVAQGNYPGAAGTATGVLAQAAVPEIIKRGMGATTERTSPLPVEDAQRGLTKAINPPDIEWESNIKNQAQFKNVEKFAKANNLPLNTQLDYARAARASANAATEFYKTHMLNEKVANKLVDVRGTGWEGEQFKGTGAATLGEIDEQVKRLNSQLRPKYVQTEGGKVLTQLSPEQTQILQAQRDKLVNILHEEISNSTGFKPEEVAQVRQTIGQQHALADQVQHAVNVRESGMSKSNEGTTFPTSKRGAIDRMVDWVTNQTPETRANKAFRKAGARAGNIPTTNLPNVPSSPVNTAPRAAASLGSIPVTNVPPEAVLGEGKGAPFGAELARGSQSSRVPTPISSALSSVTPTSPTGASLAEPPFSYPYERGQELGEIEGGQETTAREKAAAERFMKENPSALGRIKPTSEARANVVKETKTPPPAKSNPSALGKIGEATEAAKKTEVEKLKARLAELSKEKK